MKMKYLSRLSQYLNNVQIASALIWAFTIIACGWIPDKSNVPVILITAAGFHVILLTRFEVRKTKCQSR